MNFLSLSCMGFLCRLPFDVHHFFFFFTRIFWGGGGWGGGGGICSSEVKWTILWIIFGVPLVLLLLELSGVRVCILTVPLSPYVLPKLVTTLCLQSSLVGSRMWGARKIGSAASYLTTREPDHREMRVGPTVVNLIRLQFPTKVLGTLLWKLPFLLFSVMQKNFVFALRCTSLPPPLPTMLLQNNIVWSIGGKGNFQKNASVEPKTWSVPTLLTEIIGWEFVEGDKGYFRES